MNQTAFEILRSTSLPGLLEQEIERFILDGEVAPGGHLNEKEIAFRFGISRGPVREALRSLESSGLIEQVPNRGFFVRRLSAAEASDVYDVRTVLFGLAGKVLAERATDDDIARLRRFVGDMDEAIGADDHARYISLNFALHEFIVVRSGNEVLAQQYLTLVKQLRLHRAHSLMHGDAIHASNLEHHMMVDAIAARDPVQAFKAHANHVETAKGRLMAATNPLA
ncbi:DNA-binding transcriptional regulator, GntR family [Phyllobacterium sp. CL33Tsu]|uniref:FCD domain-containing protein n=1 Tax=Phyllobacterium sp. CL33Tsu TaxID=1798191 RepID=UPI0008E4CBB4|nr:FCD domain-containing protein [Phyllobacterium sp. CL33Tsu]SFJ41441.1 DNA-binding transcriptional regulator, GntR family [Phyllobacterium sp. CL33Tsu]